MATLTHWPTNTPGGFWWIETFRIVHGHYYAFRIVGTNDHNNGESIRWSVPSIAHGFAFRLREVR